MMCETYEWKDLCIEEITYTELFTQKILDKEGLKH